MSPFKICTFKELAISKEFFCGDAVHIQVPERVPGKRVYGCVCVYDSTENKRIKHLNTK